MATDSPRDLSVLHTALHGVGDATVEQAFVRAGFAAPAKVESQATPDPDFPTVAFPNPEEDGALDAAIARAQEISPTWSSPTTPMPTDVPSPSRTPMSTAAGDCCAATSSACCWPRTC